MLKFKALVVGGLRLIKQPLSQTDKLNPVNTKSLIQARLLSSGCDNLPKVNFEELRSCQTNKNVLIIDVREPNELVEYGKIDGSINIPLGEVENTLKLLPKEEFLKKYDRVKPDENSPIIFSCQKGMRSEKAQIIAQQLGFKNVKNYIGGWLDWADKTK